MNSHENPINLVESLTTSYIMKDKDILDPYSTQRSQQENNEVKRLTYQYIEKTDRNDPNYQWSLAE